MSPSFSVPLSLKHRNIPLHKLCDQHEGKRITVGVAIVSQPPPDLPKKVLLLQRAADEDVLPNMYELPGGNLEGTDATILDTVARETKEETGLMMSAVLCEFEEFEYTTRRGPARQLNFLIEVQQSHSAAASGYQMGEATPTLSPSEHQAYVWVEASNSLEGLPMSEGMRIVVKNAFKAIDE